MVDTSSPSKPDARVVHSRACFEIILRLYYLRHGFEYSDTYMTHEMTVLAFIALDQLKSLGSKSDRSSKASSGSDDIRSTLLLAAKGLSDQGKNYYMPFTLFHIVRNEMDTENVDILYKWMNVRQDDDATSQVRARHVQAQYPVNTINVTDHPERQRLGDVIKKYAELALKTQSSSAVSETDSSA